MAVYYMNVGGLDVRGAGVLLSATALVVDGGSIVSFASPMIICYNMPLLNKKHMILRIVYMILLTFYIILHNSYIIAHNFT